MSRTSLDHELVQGYMSQLDAALRGRHSAQAREVREQITAHLDDALGQAWALSGKSHGPCI